MGDFTAFTFNGLRSDDDLGIVRVSSGDRYDESLLPEFEDKTIEIPGNDGTYYYGSYYKNKSIKVNLAFDHLTEKQFRKLRYTFGGKGIYPLIFDEKPYKQFMVRLASTPDINYICFDEDKREPDLENITTGVRTIEDSQGNRVKETIIPWKYETDSSGNRIKERIYKGEMDVEFIAYYPFARAPYKAWDNAGYARYNNVDEWQKTANLKDASTLAIYDHAGNTLGYEETVWAKIPIFNPGDVSSPLQIFTLFNTTNPNRSEPYIPGHSIKLYKGDNVLERIDFDIIEDHSVLEADDITYGTQTDYGILINSKNHLIEQAKRTGFVDAQGFPIVITTGKIYNEYILRGDFFNIPAGTDDIGFSGTLRIDDITDTGENKSRGRWWWAFYDYLYY